MGDPAKNKFNLSLTLMVFTQNGLGPSQKYPCTFDDCTNTIYQFIIIKCLFFEEYGALRLNIVTGFQQASSDWPNQTAWNSRIIIFN